MGHPLFLRPKQWLEGSPTGVPHISRSLRDVGAMLRYREDSGEYASADVTPLTCRSQVVLLRMTKGRDLCVNALS